MAGHGPVIALGMGLAAAVGAAVALLVRPGASPPAAVQADVAPAPARAIPVADPVALDGLLRRVERVETEIAALRDALARIQPRASDGRSASPEDGPPAVGAPAVVDPDAPPPLPLRELADADLAALDVHNARAALVARFGKPNREVAGLNGDARLYFYEAGVEAWVDSTGRLGEMQLYGEPRSPVRSQKGRYLGLFEDEGEWFRPQRWRIDGVGIGTYLADVYERWGKAEEVLDHQNGELWVTYEARRIKLQIDWSHRVQHIEFIPRAR